jgi:hypothetical protein
VDQDHRVTTARLLRHPIHAVLATREDLEPLRADNRMSAYVYGDILVLAATAGVYDTAIRDGEALLVVLGTIVSTYVAHVVADVVGAVFGGREVWAAVLHELRDSVPIASAGIPPLLLFGAAALGWPSPEWAQAVASALLVLRLGTIGVVYHHLKEPIGVARAVWFGVVVAGVAAVAVVVKLVLTH